MRFSASVLLALALGSSAVSAQPKLSQPPRIGMLSQLAFQVGSDELPIGNEQALGKMATWAKENPQGLIVVEGHSDRSDAAGNLRRSSGPRTLRSDARTNVRLSLHRADRVVAQLLTLGVLREQIVVAGFTASRLGRRVIVWSTRAGIEVVEDQLRARGARTVRSSSLLVAHS
jgi:outer membrane protein OmpA-like peptidoglycan-associated protein